MSRIGNRKLTIPSGVTVEVNGQEVTVKGPKGELKNIISELIKVTVNDNCVETTKVEDTKKANVLQGTSNSIINGMIIGVSKGFEMGLEAVGVGYRFQVSGNIVEDMRESNRRYYFSHPKQKEYYKNYQRERRKDPEYRKKLSEYKRKKRQSGS